MKTLILIILLTSIAFAQEQDFTVPPGYEIVSVDSANVTRNDSTFGLQTTRDIVTPWDIAEFEITGNFPKPFNVQTAIEYISHLEPK